MKFNKIALVVALGLAGGAFAASDTDTVSSSAGAQIVAAIAITNGNGLHFGDVVASGVAGTVVMSPAGSRSSTGGATLGNAGSEAAAVFTVTGDPSGTYAITLPTTIQIANGLEQMTVNTFTHDANAVLAAGTETLRVGATLGVGVSQVAGAYAGTFDVTVTYN